MERLSLGPTEAAADKLDDAKDPPGADLGQELHGSGAASQRHSGYSEPAGWGAGAHAEEAGEPEQAPGYEAGSESPTWARNNNASRNSFPKEKVAAGPASPSSTGPGESSTASLAHQSTSSSSAGPPLPPKFAAMSFHSYNRLRFINLPRPVHELVRAAILASWKRGIEKEQTYAQTAYEYHVGGRPWLVGLPFSAQGAASRVLVRDVLDALHRAGWVVDASIDMSQGAGPKDCVLLRLRSEYPDPPPDPVDWLVVSFGRTDRIRLLGSDEHLRADLRADLVASGWLRREQAERREGESDGVGAAECARGAADGQVEFKVKGNPWWATGEDLVRARTLLLRLRAVLEAHGWASCAAIRHRGEDGEQADSWYLVRSKDWVRGSPFNDAPGEGAP